VSRGVNPSSARVSECLSENLVTGQPDWSVDEAMRVMSARQIGRLPVVDSSGRLVGMVTLSSLALRGRDQDEALETAQEVSRRSARIA
jgi:CBS domain-containing protein